MIRALTAAGLIVLFGTAAAAEAPAAPVVLKSEKQGDITFKHSTHKDKACTACHESDQGGKMPMDQKKGHATCQKCHMALAKADPAKKPLAACTNCHVKAKK
jgi:Class III cytochrome C family